MTREEKISTVMIMSGDQVSAEVAGVYVDAAQAKLARIVYPFGDGTEEFPAKYDSLVCEAATYMIGKRGAEGQKVHNENGIGRTYEDGDLPGSLVGQITPIAGVVR